MRRRIFRLAALALALYVAFGGVMALTQRSFIYVPFDGPTEPVAAGLSGFTRGSTQAADGTPITYWESDAEPGAPTLLYFHGNGGGLHMFTRPLAYLHAQGFHVIAMEYRGYPGAPKGKSEQNIVADGIALFDHFAQRRAPVIWGYSLGSGVATQVAAERPPTALVLEAPFTAVVDRAGELFPLLPTTLIVRDTYLSREAVTRIHAPLFIMHGEDDHIIPVHHGRALFAAANAPKTLKTYPGFGHLDLMDSPAFADAMAWLRGVKK